MQKRSKSDDNKPSDRNTRLPKNLHQVSDLQAIANTDYDKKAN